MFPDKCFGFRLEFVDEFTEIVPCALGPFIGHHQELFAWVKCVFLLILKKVFRFFITLQNYVNVNLDKTEMSMTSNEFKYITIITFVINKLRLQILEALHIKKKKKKKKKKKLKLIELTLKIAAMC